MPTKPEYIVPADLPLVEEFIDRDLTDAETEALLGQPVEDNAEFFETILAVCGGA